MKRDIGRYIQDKWNILDALALIFLFIGMVIRWDDSTNSWGPAFYALSAPLVISRVLFFAQVLPFQGPMIEASVQNSDLYDLHMHTAAYSRHHWCQSIHRCSWSNNGSLG